MAAWNERYPPSSGGGAVDSVFGESGNVTSVDYIQLDTAASPTPAVGQIRWNNTDGTPEVLLKGGNVTLQLGQEQLIRVLNTSGSTIVNGTVVYISGAQSDRVLITKASALTAETADKTIGILTEDILHNAEGFVTTSGLVRGLDTSAWNEADILYVSSTAGVLTNVAPIAPLHATAVAIVVRDHPIDGILFVDVSRGSSLSELHDVIISSPTADQALVYDAVAGVWKNSKGFIGKTDMTGFPVDSSGNYLCSLSYNETTRTVTITPTSATFDFYSLGVKYTKTGAQSITHSAVGATHFVYFDETGTLVTSASSWDILKHAMVCYIFQDVTNSRRIPFEERHHAGRDLYWHRNQHAAEGTKATGSGFQVSGYTLNTGTDTACTFAVASGRLEDEDIRVDTEVLPDNGPYTLLERVGASGDWQITRTNTIPFFRTGTNTQYNQNTGATWQRTAIANNDYVNYYIFGVTALPVSGITPAPTTTQQYIIIPGQAKHVSEALASAENVASIAWGSMPFQEIVPLYKVTLLYQSAAGGTTKITAVTRIIGTAVSVSAATQTDHGALAGLTDPDHPASAIINTPSGNLAATDVQAALNELDTEKAPKASPTFTGTTTADILVVTGNATIGDAEAIDVHSIKGATTVLANSANPALKVTQTGSGNAFVVEDVASDTTPFVIDASGHVGIGGAPEAYLDLKKNDTSVADLKIRNSVNTGLAYINTDGAYIFSSVNAFPMLFATSGTERMRIDSDGAIISSASSSFAALRVSQAGAGFVIEAIGGRNRFNSTRANRNWNTSQVECYAAAGAVADMATTSYHCQDQASAFQWGYDGTNAKFGMFDGAGNFSWGLNLSTSVFETPGLALAAAFIPSTTSTMQIGSDILFTSPNHALMGNMYYSGGWKYAGNGTGAAIKLAESSSIAMSIHIAPNNAAGGAGAVASPNTAMVILPDAKVRIGKTTSTTAFNTTFECAGPVLGQNTSSALIAYNPTIQTSIMLHCASGATDEKQTELMHADNGNFTIRTIGDAYTGVTDGLVLERGTGTTLTSVQLLNSTFKIQSDGKCLAMSSAGGLGYGTGAGGTVTQTTSKATTVTLNKPCGQITMHNAALAGGASVMFIFTNSLINGYDTIHCNVSCGAFAPDSYEVHMFPGAGTSRVVLKNVTGDALAEAVSINFAIIKVSIS